MEDDPIHTRFTIRLMLCSMLALLLHSGCAHLYDPLDESLSCVHCEVQAAHTWRYLRGNYACVAYPHHFGAGFRAGYVDVCRGGTGCPPTLPPRLYWSIWYRNASGRAKTVEWFNGFAAGAAVATQSGHRMFGQLLTASDLAGACDCQQNVEYDLSDLPPPEPPITVTVPETRQYHEEPSPSPLIPGPDTAGVLPQTEPPGSAWDRWILDVPSVPPATEPFGHSVAAPAKPDVSHPFAPEITVGTPSFVPVAPTVPAPALAVPPSLHPDEPARPAVPFGHSVGPAERAAETGSAPDASRRPSTPILPPNEAADQATRADDSVPQEETDATAPDEKPRPAATKSPDPPAEEYPPLEDLFLPRPHQEPEQPSVEKGNSVRSWRPRSLFEALNRVQPTSHRN